MEVDMRVAYQGVRGAYSELAALRALGRRIAPVPCQTFDEVFDTVTRGAADRGVIPIENSLAGSIHQNYDLLLDHALHIVGEVHLRIEHVLMGLPGTTLRSLTRIRSHPQALAQCDRFFRRHPRLVAEPYFDTAGAAASVAAEGAREVGAIASSYAARLYRLAVVRRQMENEPHNYTRFLLVGASPWPPRPTVRTKCSIVFRPHRNIVGVLFRILGVFALRDINLLKIESRPDPREPFSYLFYVDLAGSPLEAHIARALEHLQEMTSLFRLLGAYPADVNELRARRRG
jgi:prephenate dehydratase